MKINKITNSSEETIEYASKIASNFKQGTIYGFQGDLASGKTTFIKGLLSGLGYEGMVNSPTFTLINEYEGDNKVIHIDCYRENNVERWVRLGIMEYFNSNCIILIEWPEIIKTILPSNTKFINFENIDTNVRRIFTS